MEAVVAVFVMMVVVEIVAMVVVVLVLPAPGGSVGPVRAYVLSLRPFLTLCSSMDCSPPGSSVHGILQARMLGWAAMPSSRGSS